MPTPPELLNRADCGNETADATDASRCLLHRLQLDINDIISTMLVVYKSNKHLVKQVQLLLYELLEFTRLPVLDRTIVKKLQLLDRCLHQLDSSTCIHFSLAFIGKHETQYVYNVELLVNYIPFKVICTVACPKPCRSVKDLPKEQLSQFRQASAGFSFNNTLPTFVLRKGILREIASRLSEKPFADLDSFMETWCSSDVMTHVPFQNFMT